MLVLASFFNPSRNAIICTLFVMIFLVSGSWLQGQVRYLPGQPYFGRNNYIEYIAGGIPIIISAAHDGDMNPASIPTRRCLNCVTVADVGTQDIVRFLGLSLQKLFGCPPHIVINRLHRRKLDANREISEVALGNPEAEQAWREFHQFIDSAKQSSFTNNYYQNIPITTKPTYFLTSFPKNYAEKFPPLALGNSGVYAVLVQFREKRCCGISK